MANGNNEGLLFLFLCHSRVAPDDISIYYFV